MCMDYGQVALAFETALKERNQQRIDFYARELFSHDAERIRATFAAIEARAAEEQILADVRASIDAAEQSQRTQPRVTSVDHATTPRRRQRELA